MERAGEKRRIAPKQLDAAAFVAGRRSIMRRGCVFTLLLAVLVMAMAILPVISLADAGDFSGDSDWGGSGGWGGSDWGGSDWGGSDWGSGSTGSFLGGLVLGSLGGDGGSLVWVFVFLLIFAVVIRAVRSGKTRGRGVPVQTAQRSADLSALLASDPEFSQQAFLEHVSNLYVRLQNAWQKKSLEPVRPYFSGALYARLERQVQRYIDERQTNYVERIAVLAADIVDYRSDQTNDILTVLLKTRINDYVRDDATGKILRGSDTRELFMTYEWTLIRAKGVKTEALEGVERDACPACGAPINLNHTAKCEYCGNVITADDYGWVLNEIRGISQQSGN